MIDPKSLTRNWNYPTSVRFGVGRIGELPAVCKELGMQRPLLVTDPGLRGLPMIAEALAKLRAIIERQSGDPAVIDDYQRLPGAAYREAVVAPRSGYVTGLNAEFVGRASIALGAGRERAGQRIDHGAGVLIAARVGDKVSAGDPVLNLLSNNAGSFGAARALAEEAIAIGDAAPPARPLLIDICTAN